MENKDANNSEALDAIGTIAIWAKGQGRDATEVGDALDAIVSVARHGFEVLSDEDLTKFGIVASASAL